MVDAMGCRRGAFALGVSGWFGRHTFALKVPTGLAGALNAPEEAVGAPSLERSGDPRTLRNARERSGTLLR